MGTVIFKKNVVSNKQIDTYRIVFFLVQTAWSEFDFFIETFSKVHLLHQYC